MDALAGAESEDVRDEVYRRCEVLRNPKSVNRTGLAFRAVLTKGGGQGFELLRR